MAADLRLDANGCLHLDGRLDRKRVETLWPQLQPLQPRMTAIQLAGLSGLDSAGLAFLVTLANAGITLQGTAPDLAELSAAYRLPASLVLPSTSPFPV